MPSAIGSLLSYSGRSVEKRASRRSRLSACSSSSVSLKRLIPGARLDVTRALPPTVTDSDVWIPAIPPDCS